MGRGAPVADLQMRMPVSVQVSQGQIDVNYYWIDSAPGNFHGMNDDSHADFPQSQSICCIMMPDSDFKYEYNIAASSAGPGRVPSH